MFCQHLWPINEYKLLGEQFHQIKLKKGIISTNLYVVVNFLSQVIFVFLLFWVMVMYANEVETKEKEKLSEIKS